MKYIKNSGQKFGLQIGGVKNLKTKKKWREFGVFFLRLELYIFVHAEILPLFMPPISPQNGKNHATHFAPKNILKNNATHFAPFESRNVMIPVDIWGHMHQQLLNKCTWESLRVSRPHQHTKHPPTCLMLEQKSCIACAENRG